MKIFRFMRPEWKAILLVFLLLAAQAACDLALPGYTSSLVNVGVQQGGIPSALAERLSGASLEDLSLLMDQGEQAAVRAAYRPDGTAFLLRDDIKDSERETARKALTLPMAVLFSLGNMPGGEQLLPALRGGQISRETVLARVGEMMPLAAAGREGLLTQAAAGFVRAEYAKLGVDLDAVRNRYLWDRGLMMLLITLLSAAAALLTSFISGRTGARIGRRLRGDVFAQVLSFSCAEVDRFSTASLITRSTNDVSQIQQTSVMVLRMILYAPIMAIGGIWRVTQVRTGLGWIVAVTVGLMVALVAVVASVVTPKFRLLQKLVDRMNLVARENLTGVQVVRAFGREAQETVRWEAANRELTGVNRFINYAFAYTMPLMMLIINGVSLLILWFGAQGIDAGRMQVGDMIAFISYTLQIAFSFMMMAMAGTVMLPRAEVAAGRVQEVLDTRLTVVNPAQPRPLPDASGEGLRFEGVSFRYPGSQEEVLHGVSFSALPGETVAVIGATGSGKSSLLQLIPRFFDATEGRVLLDGVDVREADLRELRGRIGFVPQHAVLFSGTIGSNLRFADETMPQEAMEAAARVAQADRFIAEREEGYRSAVSQGGGNLSGGQKQRLSIARALAMKPRVLLFDDSFSSLDYRTDLLVRQALKKEQRDAIVLIVAQRVATVMGADRILVLDEGRLAGQGTHEELMASCPAYVQIARSQLSEEELAGKGGAKHV